MIVAELIIAAFLVIAGIFGLVGSFGLIRLRETMQRLHAPTKATTVGVGGVLIASMLYAALFEGRLSWQELLVTLFLLIGTPITGHFIAKAHMHLMRDKEDLPKPGPGKEWATYTPDHALSRTDDKP